MRVACTQGPDLEHYGLKAFEKALEFAGENHADLVLLPEYMNGEMVREPLSGPSAKLMSEQARKHRMYVAGTIEREDKAHGKLYNTAMLHGRNGELMGTYDKIHLYGLELTDGPLTPGTTVPVFRTDFGKIGFVTCADIGHADVATSAVEQGAGILLFPNLGYNPAVARTRAAENGVWLLASTRGGAHNVWDGSGTDLMTTGTRDRMRCRDVVEHRIDGLGILVVSLELDATPAK